MGQSKARMEMKIYMFTVTKFILESILNNPASVECLAKETEKANLNSLLTLKYYLFQILVFILNCIKNEVRNTYIYFFEGQNSSVQKHG